MSFKLFSIFLILSILVPFSLANNCQVSSKSYTANDGLILVSTGHIISFTTNCPDSVPAYAIVNGRTVSVVQGEDGRSYQISWTNDMASSSSGSYEIPVFDENGYQLFRKAQRSGSNDGKPLFTLPFQHKSPYSGPMVRTEFAVLVISLLFCYHAISLRFKIMSKKI